MNTSPSTAYAPTQQESKDPTAEYRGPCPTPDCPLALVQIPGMHLSPVCPAHGAPEPKPAPHTSVEVAVLPACDMCSALGLRVVERGRGPWADMCLVHFEDFGVGLGLGRGQRLVVR